MIPLVGYCLWVTQRLDLWVNVDGLLSCVDFELIFDFGLLCICLGLWVCLAVCF